jgi:L-asparaginase II
MPKAIELVELARVWRGPVVESVHSGAVIVCDLQGRYRHTWGDPGWATTPRSALKPFQAIAMVESGAADALGLTDEHIALACASHYAEPNQVALVRDWLGKLGLDESALICGPAWPRGDADIAEAAKAGGKSRVYNNCSGKHCGFLSMAKQLGGGLAYGDLGHPAQKLYLDVLGEFTGRDPASFACGIDGCGLPAVALSLGDMARAGGRLAVGWARTPQRRAAIRRVLGAMVAHPDLIAGKDEAIARLIRYTEGGVIAKGGAEGFLLAGVKDSGLGIAIKMGDGAARGKFGVLARILGRIHALPTAEAELLIEALEPPILNSNGTEVGKVEITIQRPVATKPTKATFGFWTSGLIDLD